MAVNSDYPALFIETFRFGIIDKISKGDHAPVYFDGDRMSKTKAMSRFRKVRPAILPDLWKMKKVFAG